MLEEQKRQRTNAPAPLKKQGTTQKMAQYAPKKVMQSDQNNASTAQDAPDLSSVKEPHHTLDVSNATDNAKTEANIVGETKINTVEETKEVQV